MDINVSYVTDSRGRRRSVQLSLADWNKVQRELERARMKADLREALQEIREIEAGRQPVVTLQKFLQEWDDEQQVQSNVTTEVSVPEPTEQAISKKLVSELTPEELAAWEKEEDNTTYTPKKWEANWDIGWNNEQQHDNADGK